MSADRADDSGVDAPGARIEEAERRLQKAADSAESAEKRATAEIRALEADLEQEKLKAAEALESVRESFRRDLERESEAREKSIAAAEQRLAEIESQAEAAERRVAEAERRASAAEERIAEERARAREAAASWLREQVASIRREAAGR